MKMQTMLAQCEERKSAIESRINAFPATETSLRLSHLLGELQSVKDEIAAIKLEMRSKHPIVAVWQ